MWLVRNETLRPILIRYNDIIDSVFRLILEESSKHDKIHNLKSTEYLSNLFLNHEILDNRLLNIKKDKNGSFKSLLEEIILLSYCDLRLEYDYFLFQNDSVNNKEYNLTQIQHPEKLTQLFKEYFYEKFFGVEWIWEDLVGQKYKREFLKEKIKIENDLSVCPYCDVDTISSHRNSWIEHFLPKAKYPYVACNPNNLIPSCTACNVSGTGKGENVKSPIYSLYNEQIGDQVAFEFNASEIKIPANSKKEIENYVVLLKLRERYNTDSTKKDVFNVLTKNYNLFQTLSNKGLFDESTYFDYIYDIGKTRGFYFIQKDLLKYIDKINDLATFKL